VVGTTAALQNAGVTTDSFYAIFNAGLKANIAALQDTGSGYASTLQANAGTYYNEAGELLEEGESLGGEFVSELPANAGTFLSDAGTFLVDEGVPVVFGEATTVVEGAATLSAAVPALVVGTGAAFLNRDALYHKINDAYMATFQPEPGNVLSNKALIQHILRNPLGRQLLGDITADGTPLSSISLDTLVEILNIVSQNVRQAQTQSVTSHDPNAIIGPAGYGAEGFVPLNTLLPYEIDFTNESTASAPAQVVTITEQLSNTLDWSTFQLGDIGFGSTTLAVPAGLQTYTTTVSISTALSVIVAANLDTTTGIVTWTFTSIDPTTGDVPSDPLSGFLPPDVTSPEGEGFVSYTVKPATAAVTGAGITAQAAIVFDNNAAIDTGTVTNTLDAVAPTSTVAGLAATQTRLAFPVSWSGSDDTGGSGVASYTVFVSIDGGAYSPWFTATSAGTKTYTGTPGHTYSFYSVATDNAGNQQLTPAAQATTTIPAVARTLTVTKGHPAKFIDAAGATITVSLSGLGTGTLSFISVGNADPVGFALTGTTTTSSISVTGGKAGALALTDISITGSLKTFTAASADLIGSFAISGTLGTLTFDNTIDGPVVLSVGGAAVATAFKFGTVSDLSLTTAAPIKSLSALAWTNGASATDALTAPSIGTLSIRGNFDATLTLSSTGIDLKSATISGSITGGTWTLAGSIGTLTAASIATAWTGAIAGSISTLTTHADFDGTLTASAINTLRVGGNLNGSTVTLTGAVKVGKANLALNALTVTGEVLNSAIVTTSSVGTITLGGSDNSRFLLGVPATTTTLPTLTSAFTSASTLGTFTSKGKYAFADTIIAASAVTTVHLTTVTVANGGVPFGLSTEALALFTLSQPKTKTFTYTKKQPASALATLPGDLKVELV
jgi:hypothetical protein